MAGEMKCCERERTGIFVALHTGGVAAEFDNLSDQAVCPDAHKLVHLRPTHLICHHERSRAFDDTPVVRLLLGVPHRRHGEHTHSLTHSLTHALRHSVTPIIRTYVIL